MKTIRSADGGTPRGGEKNLFQNNEKVTVILLLFQRFVTFFILSFSVFIDCHRPKKKLFFGFLHIKALLEER